MKSKTSLTARTFKDFSSKEKSSIINLLPYDGITEYYGKILKQEAAQYFFNSLLNTIEWKNDEVIIFGKQIITKRKTAWYADNGYEYTYSNVKKHPLEWTKDLLELKFYIESITGEIFNSCLLNLYHDGSEGMSWHSDNEKEILKDSAIAALSFGAERKFYLKHRKNKLPVSHLLENGSLLVMKGSTQKNWQHSLPKAKKITTARISLTFRLFSPDTSH